MRPRSRHETLVTIVLRELNVQLTVGFLRVERMGKLLEVKAGGGHFPPDLWKVLREYNDVCVHSVNRLDVAVNRQSADQTP